MKTVVKFIVGFGASIVTVVWVLSVVATPVVVSLAAIKYLSN